PADDRRLLVIAEGPSLTFFRVVHGMGLRKSYANSYQPTFQFHERQDNAHKGMRRIMLLNLI
ncbi:MAG: hypothetical protein RIC55_36225, partial [Pirellulaceae bacterium]